MATMLFSAALHPGRALGFLVLGASLHDVLTRLKAEPLRFPEIQLVYSRDRPVHEPVIVQLPASGLRLRFDGPEQRLRLIEVTDFTKNHITFKDRDVVRPTQQAAHSPTQPDMVPVPVSVSGAGELSTSGPKFRHIYHRLLGPTYGGEYIPGQDSPDQESSRVGLYVLSYPGVAFTFPLAESAYSPEKDVVSLLSPGSGPGSAAGPTALCMAIFSGDSWAAARDGLWAEVLPSIKSSPALPRGKEICPDEVSLIRIHGGGQLQLLRRWTNASSWIYLGETTAQELVAELGPPNAIYRRSDQKMVIHRLRAASGADILVRGGGRPDELTDTDQSSLQTGSDTGEDCDAMTADSLDSNDQAGRGGGDGEARGGHSGSSGCDKGEYFYNYFHLGFDVLVSAPTTPSRPPETGDHRPRQQHAVATATSTDQRVATKLVLHGNIPGSYEFNRHRRCRWEISYLPMAEGGGATSETKFEELEAQLAEAWRQPRGQRQRGMALNRGWGDSPGSSCEFLGGWEDDSNSLRRDTTEAPMPSSGGDGDNTTTLFGFPGLVFEVLHNGYVNDVTVF